jgi:beta-phosphoglucomutase-like phosphatase (HAD superfamily)
VIELDTVAARWQIAFDTAERALADAVHPPVGAQLAGRHHDLLLERQETSHLLRTLAQAEGVRPAPWLPTFPVSRALLGLPADTAACLFDLDGVLTDSGVLHAHAWAEVFDELLRELSEQTHRHFTPFDVVDDYRTFVEGRTRLEGVHAFLESRGIHVSQDRERELAARKASVLAHGLHERGVSALPGARRYLEAAGHAGVRRAVVSASASTTAMLELAGLASLIDARLDGEVMRKEDLPSRPRPDLLLWTCERLGVEPAQAVGFTRSADGAAAAAAAGIAVEDRHLERLLDPRIAR